MPSSWNFIKEFSYMLFLFVYSFMIIIPKDCFDSYNVLLHYYCFQIRHCVKYARIRDFSDPYFRYKHRIYSSVLMPEYSGQRKLILCVFYAVRSLFPSYSIRLTLVQVTTENRNQRKKEGR